MRRIEKHTPQIPQACAGCYRQPLDKDYVDFDVYHDGGTVVLGESEDVLQRKSIPVDDLILCEDCVAAAAKLVGLGSVEDVEAQLADAQRDRDGALAAAEQHKAFGESLQAALAVKPEEVAPAPVESPDLDELKGELKTARRKATMAENKSEALEAKVAELTAELEQATAPAGE